MIIARDKVQALMPHQTLTKIQGEPTHKAIRKLEKELGANLIAVDCPWGHNKGHLGELQDAATFLACNGIAYTDDLACLSTIAAIIRCCPCANDTLAA